MAATLSASALLDRWGEVLTHVTSPVRGSLLVWGMLAVVLVVAAIVATVWLIAQPYERSTGQGSDRARELLGESYADGKLSSEEYLERVRHLC